METESVHPDAADSEEEEEEEGSEEEDSETEAHENAKKSHLDRGLRRTVRDGHREFQPGGGGHEALVEAYASHPLFQAANSQRKATPSAGKRAAAVSKGPKAKIPRTVNQRDVELVKKALIPDETATKGRWASEIFMVMAKAGFNGGGSELGDVMKEAFGGHDFVKKSRGRKGMKWFGLTDA